MKSFLTSVALFFSLTVIGQIPAALNRLEITGSKQLVLRMSENQETEAVGKLSTGEAVKAGCYEGDCYFRIDYKGRILQNSIDPSNVFEVYEYDFGGDDDKEIVLINFSEYSPNIVVLSYSKGNVSLMLQEEISPNKTSMRQNYIECFDETGLPTKAWHYYKGIFWEMTPVSYD